MSGTTASGTGVPARVPVADRRTGAVDRAWLHWLEMLATRVDRLGRDLGDAAPAVGDVLVSAASHRGPGWLRCDGSTYPRVDYPVLAALLDPNPVPPDRPDFAIPLVPDTGYGGRHWIRATR